MHSMTVIDLLRHGACEGGDIYRGSIDVALSAEGWAQMRAQVANPAPWQQVFTSPMQRCKALAAEVCEQLTLPLTEVSALAEIHFGDWEGRVVAEIWHEQREHVRRFFADPINCSPPNGERLSDFDQRVDEAWQQVVAKARGQQVLLVAHGGTIRVILARLLGMPLSNIAHLEVPYACASRVVIHHADGEPDFASVQFHNGKFA